MIPFQLARQTETSVELSQHCVADGCTVLEALYLININLHINEHNDYTVGVWSRSLKPEQLLKSGDRVELYYPLQADPKDARRARVSRTITQQATKDNAANRAAKVLRRLKYPAIDTLP
jgi:uncharacterized protein